MAQRPVFDVPKSNEQLVQLYDYIYSNPDNLFHPHKGKLKPYGSHDDRDRTHLFMISKMIGARVRYRPGKGTVLKGCDLSMISVLDASCGRGHLLRTLLTMGFNAHGTEVSDYLLDNDLKYLPVAKATYDDINSVVQPESFDIVVTNDVLEHLLDEEMVSRAMSNLCDISKKWVSISVGLKGTAARKYPKALGLNVERLHLFCKSKKWWYDYLHKFLKKVEVVPGRRASMGSFYGEKK